jgi:MFS family permease
MNSDITALESTAPPTVPLPTPLPPSFATSLRLLPHAFWVKWGGTLLNRTGMFVWPFLTLYMTRRGFSEQQAGWALGVAGAGSLAAAAIGGWLADVLGRRETMVLSLVGSAISLLLLGLTASLPALLLCCFAYGLLVDAMNPASQALVADLVPPEHRLAAYSADRLAINLGFTLGPMIAGFVLEKSFWALFVADAITSIAYAAIAFLWLPRTVATVRTWKLADLTPQFDRLREVWRHRPLLTYLLAEFLLGIAFRQFNGGLVLQMAAAGGSGKQMGFIYMINGLLIVMVEIPLTHLTRRWPLRGTIALGAVIIGSGFALNAFGVSIKLVVASMIVLTIGEMLTFSRTTTYLANLSPPDRRGRYAGLKSFAWGSGGILGATLGLMLYGINPTALWISCGVVGALAAAILVLPLRLKPRVTAPAEG